MNKTSASPLALIYAGLLVYASLYPFADWRDQGIVPWAFLSAPFPKYWTYFDVVTNVVGYAPFGFLLVLSALRRGKQRHVIAVATLMAGALSLIMESVQGYLPNRVPSNVDLGLNVIGAGLGAWLAWALERMGVVARWRRFRSRWFVEDARGALVLLALWPLALMFPAAVPFGLGQVLERIEATLAVALQNTPFLNWLPLRVVELQPLVPIAELVCVMLGIVIPCLMGYCVIRSVRQRPVLVLAVFAVGMLATALSAALSYGPEHAWAWFSPAVKAGLVSALVLLTLMLGVTRRGGSALVLLALGIYLSLLNQAPTSAYFAQTLSTWEQGRFIRFHGLAQWLGWSWPYAVLVYTLTRVGARELKN